MNMSNFQSSSSNGAALFVMRQNNVADFGDRQRVMLHFFFKRIFMLTIVFFNDTIQST